MDFFYLRTFQHLSNTKQHNTVHYFKRVFGFDIWPPIKVTFCEFFGTPAYEVMYTYLWCPDDVSVNVFGEPSDFLSLNS